MAPEPERLLSGSDVAHILKLTPSAVSNWVSRQKTDRLPAPDFVIGWGVGTRMLWRPETIEQFLNGQAESLQGALQFFLEQRRHQRHSG